jgi:hypothetical protein
MHYLIDRLTAWAKKAAFTVVTLPRAQVPRTAATTFIDVGRLILPLRMVRRRLLPSFAGEARIAG